MGTWHTSHIRCRCLVDTACIRHTARINYQYVCSPRGPTAVGAPAPEGHARSTVRVCRYEVSSVRHQTRLQARCQAESDCTTASRDTALRPYSNYGYRLPDRCRHRLACLDLQIVCKFQWSMKPRCVQRFPTMVTSSCVSMAARLFRFTALSSNLLPPSSRTRLPLSWTILSPHQQPSGGGLQRGAAVSQISRRCRACG